MKARWSVLLACLTLLAPSMGGASASSSVRAGATPMPAPLRMTTPHTYVSDGDFPVALPVAPQPTDPRWCGKDPLANGWPISAAAVLYQAHDPEMAYLQERDVFGTPDQIGYLPEVEARLCLGIVIHLGHYTDHPIPHSAFFITDRHVAGGPMYCATKNSLAAVEAGGGIGIAYSGGPIVSPEACAALPRYRSIKSLQSMPTLAPTSAH